MSRQILGIGIAVSKRYISSDSGLPDRFDQTFKQRDNPLAPL
jgi:hypothetical protein